MPSRKKARGRQNRAKKEATRTADMRALWERTLLCDNGVNDDGTCCSCAHMAMPLIPQELGPAVSFMNHIAGKGFFDNTAASLSCHSVEFCLPSVMRFPDVTTEESERSLASDLLLRNLRNILVHDSAVGGENWFHSFCAKYEVAICYMVSALELLGTYSDLTVVKMRYAKTSCRLAGGNRRDVVKFVAKRLPCTCMKTLHCATKRKVKKVAHCQGCEKPFPRSQLFVCTGCMLAEYCSRECQRADWLDHKQEVMSKISRRTMSSKEPSREEQGMVEYSSVKRADRACHKQPRPPGGLTIYVPSPGGRIRT
ncbi:hypothetical protein THAOC_27110 [Thalassiosira oceanica]|uniref:MYND-type domain-containing protein n=1 Tax=Thalassiosira oceanica TaxID=159749 RepID=K0S3H5_THAOC|nr:hypothetical protein THAOC_27110 [Thalassiosira oceanica]|eukprot:EJK53457.1 hypothetical protein THAOC_27110 [Thalassiosira oceanica]